MIKITSGGQTGADRAALDVAIEFKIKITLPSKEKPRAKK